jgi:GDP-4-dehydro-6-deoxy-D-mannose reductase
MKILVFGITGFAGTSMYHFLNHLDGNSIYGTFRHSTGNRNIADNFSRATLLECDINDVYSVEKALSESQPDIIFHFASYVSVFNSLKNPLPIFQTNIIGTTNLMEGIKKIVPKAKILIPGSAEEYGRVPEDKMPIKETYPLNPVNPYAISKKVQEEIGFYYFKHVGLNVYFTRTFHYTGPRQPLGFVCSDIVKQVVDVEVGKAECIKVGNLDAKRDFTDIRDVVNAYWNIITSGKAGEVFNVCTGKSIKIQDILDKLITFSGKHVLVEIDKNKLRQSDVPDFVGDNTKLRSIGWMPQYTIDKSLIDLLEWRRNEIRTSYT